MFERERTKPHVIRYTLYLYYLGLSLRSISRAIQPFVDKSYAAMIWYWIQEFDRKYVYPNKKKSRITAAFIIDETQIQIGSTEAVMGSSNRTNT